MTDKYSDLTLSGNQERELGGALEQAIEFDPMQSSRTDKLSRDSGLPFDVVEGNEDQVEKNQKYRNLNIREMIETSPSTVQFLGEPTNARQAHDDVEQLSGIEKTLRNLSDIPRAFGTEIVRFGGRGLSGLGEMYDSANRIAAKGLYAITPGSFEDFMTKDRGIPEWATPTGLLHREGDLLKQNADIIDVPEERKNFATDVAGGLGQMTAQIALTIVQPQAALGAMFAQGADQMADRQEAQGVKGDTFANDLAILNAAGWMGLTERTGIDKILNRVPPQIKNRIISKLADLSIAGGIEAVQEVVEGIGMNLIEYAAFNPEAEFFEGIEHEASVAGTTGAIMRGIVMAIAPGRAVGATHNDQAKLNQINELTEKVALRTNNPEVFREAMAKMGIDTQTESLYVNPEAARELFQSANLAPELAEKPSVQAMAADIEAAIEEGRDVAVPLADYMTDMVGTELQTQLANHMKLNIDAMTVEELSNLDIQKELERIQSMDSEQRAASSEIYSDIVGQFVGMGWDQSTAESYAALHEATFNTLSNRTGVDAKDLYERYALDISREIDPSLKERAEAVESIDIMLDMLRAGNVPTDADIFGKSITQFIKEKGGILDEGGELDARDASVGQVGRNRLARSNGRTLDDVAEYLVEEGYIADRSPEAVLEAIDRELAGNPVYPLGTENQEKMQIRDQLNELGDILDQAGLDLQNLDNKAVVDALSEITYDNEQVLHQAEMAENLIVTHNLSAENLLHAADLGGLAAPSIATIRTDVSDFDAFGEISLLADPSLLESEKARTFDADIYSPRQPRATYDVNMDRFNELVDRLAEGKNLSLSMPDIQSLEDSTGAERLGSYSAVQYLYLKELGKAPKLKKRKVEATIKSAAKLENIDVRDPLFQRAAHKHFTKMLEKVAAADEGRVDRYRDFWFDENGNVIVGKLYDFESEVRRFKQEGVLDTHALRNDLDKKLKGKKARAEYDLWVTDLFNSMLDGKKLFKGFTPSGNRKYAEYNMLNIVKEMTQQLQGGEASFYGAGSVRSAYANEMKTVAKVQANREKIISKGDMEVIKEDAQSVFDDAMERLKPYYKYDSDGWGYGQDAGSAIMEGRKGIREAFENDPEVWEIVGELTDYLAALPSSYFETKIQRAVDFSEFNTAVVPKGTRKDVLEILRGAGLKVKMYDAEGKGKTRQQIVAEQKKLLFQDSRGKYVFDGKGMNKIILTPGADLSTFLHESGHFFLQVMRDLGGADTGIQADVAAIDAWAKSQGAETDTDVHEMFASGFETYLMEGKAPTPELQPLFSRFKSWLKLVYKNINRIFGTNDLGGVELSDEVRSVMDRMLATDQAIADAEQSHMFGPMPVEQYGVSPEEAVEYQKIIDEADEAANEALTAQVMAELQRENTLEWKQAVKAKAVEVRTEVAHQPAYAARDYFSGDHIPDGVIAAKLNADHIRTHYGNGPANRMMRMTSKDGYHPDQLASMFGFRTGDELVRAILGTKNKAARETMIRKQAEEMVRDERGDMLNDGRIAEEAARVVHNDKQAERLLFELRLLNKAAGNQQTPRQYFKAAADQKMSITPIDQIRPDIHRKNEIKARNAAVKAAAEGDYEKAATEQHKAVRQFYLYRAAMESKTQADKYRTRLSQMQKTKYSARKVHADYLQAMKVLLSAYDMRKNPENSDAKLAQVKEFAKAQYAANPDLIAFFETTIETENALGEKVSHTVPAGILESIKSWKSMTLEDLGAVKDAAENILAIGKANSLEANEVFRQEADSLAASIEANTRKPKKAIPSRSLIKKGIAEFSAHHRKLESLLQELDGWVDNGPMARAIFDPLWEAQLAEVDRAAAEHKALDEVFAGYEYLFSGVKDNLQDYEVFGRHMDLYKLGNRDLSRSERLVLALNWGNEGNREAMRTQDGMPLTDAEIMGAIETLTTEELELVNKLWEYVDKFYPELAKIEQEVTGIAPAKVNPDPFTVNGVEMRGGYYPLQADSAMSFTAEMNSVEERAEKMRQGGKARATTKHGSTIERKGFAGQMVDLSIDGLFKHVDGVVHDITHRKAVMQVDRFLRDASVRDAATKSIGAVHYKHVSQAIVRLAGGNTHPTDLNAATRLMRWSRAAISYGAMGYSLRTALVNLTGFAPALTEVGGVRLAAGFARQVQNPIAFGREIMEKSTFMKHRGETITRDVFEINRNLKGNTKWNAFKSHAFWMLTKVDAFISRAVWAASYHRDIAKGVDENLAIKNADRVVARTQSTGMKIDLSAIEDSNELIKAITPMYTYFNAVLSMQKRNNGKRKTGQISRRKWLMNMLWIYTVPMLMEEALLGGDDADEEEPMETVERYARSQASYVAGQWFFLREASSVIKYGMMFPAPHQKQAAAIPMAIGEAGEALVAAFSDEEYEFDKNTIRTGTDLLPVLGFPSGAQLNRMGKYMYELEQEGGDFSPWGLLVTGKQPDE